MSEADVIHEEDYPITIETLVRDLRACGLQAGQSVMVHTAMSKLGWVAGGPQAVVMALQEVLGSEGILMMPTHSTHNTDPGHWRNPPVPDHWVQIIRDHTPAYDPATTPTRMMGVVAELFRTWPGVIRSNHPTLSAAVWGKHAEFLTANHALESETGDQSPMARLYDLDGYVLLIGVGHFNNTSLHLAEERADYPGKSYSMKGSAMLVDGKRAWVNYKSFDVYGDDFGEAGAAFDAAHNIRIQKVGKADVRFFSQRACVDFAIRWFSENRDLT